MSRGSLPPDLLKLRRSWEEFLTPHRWDVVMTLTFGTRTCRPWLELSPERADKDFRRLIRFANEQLYGKRWIRKTWHKGVVWVRVQEAHRDGTLHYHACLHSPSKAISGSLVALLQGWWSRRIGMARVEVPTNHARAVAYVVKNAGCGPAVEVELSHNFHTIARL